MNMSLTELPKDLAQFSSMMALRLICTLYLDYSILISSILWFLSHSTNIKKPWLGQLTLNGNFQTMTLRQTKQ